MDAGKLNAYLFHILGEDFASDDPSVRRQALYALGRLGKGDDVLEKIRDLATHDPDAGLRYAAKKALDYWDGSLSAQEGQFQVRIPTNEDGEIDGPAFAELLDSADAGTQIAALMEAMRIGDVRMLPILSERVESEEDPWVLSLLIKAVGALGSKGQLALLSRFLHHPNARVVANTVDALDMIGDEDAAPLVLPLLNSEDNRVRANAVRLVHKFDPEAARRTLRAMSESKKDWMRDSAIYCLRVLDDEHAVPTLLRMLADEPSDELCSKLCRVLGERGGEDCLLPLLRIAREGGTRGRGADEAARSLAEREDLDVEAFRERLVSPSRASQALPALSAADLAVPSDRPAMNESGIHRPLQPEELREDTTAGPSVVAPSPSSWFGGIRDLTRGSLSLSFRDLAFLGGGILLLFLGIAFTLSRDARPSTTVSPVKRSLDAGEDLVARIATMRDPKSAFGTTLRGEGKVVTVQPGKGWVLRVGAHHVSVRLELLPPDVQAGDRLRFEGTVTGRSLFGVVFVDLSSWDRIP